MEGGNYLFIYPYEICGGKVPSDEIYVERYYKFPLSQSVYETDSIEVKQNIVFIILAPLKRDTVFAGGKKSQKMKSR